MLRFLSSRTCELCSKTSSLASISRSRSKNILYHLQRLDMIIPTQSDLSYQFLGVTSYRSLSTGNVSSKSDKNDGINFSDDPEVIKWLREMQSDFSKETKYEDENVVENRKWNDNIKYQEEQKKSEANGQMNKDQLNMQDDNASVEAEVQFHSKPSFTKWSKIISQKYEKFDSRSSEIIYDYDEVRLQKERGMVTEQIEEEEVEEIVLERGETGVFDVEELIDLLREQNAKDIAVIQIPPDLRYVAYMVIVSSHSQRHIRALAELVRKIYKKKKHSRDHSLILEGTGTDWVALDMGNIALHIMNPEMREKYDLETLWTVGSHYDDKCQQQEEKFMDVYNLSDPLAEFTPRTISPENKSLG